MSEIASTAVATHIDAGQQLRSEKPDHVWRRLLHNGRFVAGGLMLLLILGACTLTLFWTGRDALGVDEDGYPISNPYYFDAQDSEQAEAVPSLSTVAFAPADRIGIGDVVTFAYPDGGSSPRVLSVTILQPAPARTVDGQVIDRIGEPVEQLLKAWRQDPFFSSLGTLYGGDPRFFVAGKLLRPNRVQRLEMTVAGKSAVARENISSIARWFGTDNLGRSILTRCLFGGTVSLEIGLAAAVIAVLLGVTVGLIAGYRGGWTDALLMRTVDIMYGLPYVLLIILLKIALEEPLSRMFHDATIANRAVLFMAIGLVSWLTMARVVRGQVLSLRGQPFIEAGRAIGLPSWRIFLFHLLPNIVGPIIVYATLTVPQAILSEAFLSFLGIGIQAPMPTWGSMAADGLVPALKAHNPSWWRLLFPCTLLALTLLSLNFLGDGLRDVFDPKRGESAKI